MNAPLKSLEDLHVLHDPLAIQGAIFAPEITTPPEDWRDRSELQFSCFVAHCHEDECLHCGTSTKWMDVFRAFVRKNGTSARRMIPFAYPIPAKAEIILFRLPPRKVPVCANCLTDSQTGENVYLVSSEAAWNEAQRREQEARLNERRQATARRNAGNPAMTMDINDVPSDL